jgi:hypothetical protein
MFVARPFSHSPIRIKLPYPCHIPGGLAARPRQRPPRATPRPGPNDAHMHCLRPEPGSTYAQINRACTAPTPERVT